MKYISGCSYTDSTITNYYSSIYNHIYYGSKEKLEVKKEPELEEVKFEILPLFDPKNLNL